MKPQAELLLIAVGALCAAIASSPARAQSRTQTLPAGLESTEGNAATAYPFDTAETQRWHWVYGWEQFEAGYPIRIQSIELRPDSSEGSWALTGYANVEVRLGTARFGYERAQYAPAFEANWTSGAGTPFFSGNVIVTSGSSSATPSPWTVRIAGTPFDYDPTLGQDLIIDVRTNGTGPLSNPLLHAIDAQVGSTGTNGGNRYGNRSEPQGLFWDMSNDELAPVVRVTYVPADGLHPELSADVRSGASPLAVQFTDRSVSSHAGGVTSWAWDLDGDGLIDSNARHPSFVYPACGRYDVSLTVTDALHPAATKTKTSYIEVDPATLPVADFVLHPPRGRAPFAASFFDRSTGGATSWEWDLDGDGVTDSTLRDPWFTYNTPGRYSVRLTARNACGESTVTRVGAVQVLTQGQNVAGDLLQYQLDELRGTDVHNTASSNAFPLVGRASRSAWMSDPGRERSSFRVTEAGFGCLGPRPSGGAWIDTGAALNLSGSSTLMFWIRRREDSTIANPFAYVLGDGRLRILLAGQAGASIGIRGTVIGDFFARRDLIGDREWHHLALVIDDLRGVADWYVDGLLDSSTLFLPGTFTYRGTSNLSVAASAGAAPLTQHFDLDDLRWVSSALSSADISGSMWGEFSAASPLDPGCTINGLAAQLSASARPRTSTTISLDLQQAEPQALAVIAIGFTAHLGGLLPLPLPGILEPPCTLGLLPDVSVVVATGALGTASFPIAIPNEPLLWVVHAYAQALILGTRGASSNVLDLNLKRD